MPRQLKLTEELIEQAVKLIEAGNYQKHVAQALGVSEETWYRWMREGEQRKSALKRKFYEEIKKAEARAVARNVALIQKAAQDGNWQAAAWWLERKYPDEWGRKERNRIEFENQDLGIKIEIKKVYVDQESEGDK